MLGRILKKDILRNKIITMTLFVFITLAAMLVASAIGIIIELFGSMDSLFVKGAAPHYMQMHSGEIDQFAIDSFVSDNDIVKYEQTVEMINIDSSNIFLGEGDSSETGSVMEISFVKQNARFDFLLDMDSQILKVSDGEIGVPVYYMQKNNLNIGDRVKIVSGGFEMEFTITAFVRDVQMNPSIVVSKRFLISDNDWEKLKVNLGESEYLIEFLLTDVSLVSEFEIVYQASDLPQKDTVVTYSLFKMLNALTDGIVAAVVILISILLIAIASLCLRFTMIATMEEDYREIGVMKAIGIHGKDIRGLYLTKYIVLAATACICGYILSLFVGEVFTSNITLYMGTSEKSILNQLIPFVGVILVFVAVVLFCRLVLRRFKRISAVEALRSGNSADTAGFKRGFVLHKSIFPNVNVFLGAKEVLGRFRVYVILCFVFTICAFLMIVPLNFLNTVNSPKFISYMGAGQSDIRIDLQKTEDIEKRYNDMVAYIQNDNDVEKYTALVTSSFRVLNSDGVYENIKVEIGDFSVFPLEYSSGSAPQQENEIALSVMNANEFQKNIGDTLTLIVDGHNRDLTICGIYQDVTNGGKTAKAILPYNADDILWYVLNLNVKEGADIRSKMKEYGNSFYPAKVNDMDEYVSQTLGTMIQQLTLVVKLALVLGIAIAILITAMFFKMLIAKDASQISIMRSLGFSPRNIRTQYITRALLVLLIGIVVGTLLANTLGQSLGGLLVSGVSSIEFVINPVVSYILCPLSLILSVTITIILSIRKVD